MEYLLKTSALLLLFYIGYKLFLQKETFFGSNRWFLLLGLILSFTLPLVVIPVYETQVIQVPTLDNHSFTSTPVVQGRFNQVVVPEVRTFNWEALLWTLYLIGVGIFALRFVIQLISIYFIIRGGKRKPFESYTIFETKKEVSPFSFFKAIIYNPFQLSDTAIDQILTHEKVHVKDWHSVDIILSELAMMFMWFNPLLWWYQKSLKQNLEFIADEQSVKEVPCAKTYQTVLINQCLPSYQLAITNNFHNSFLKKRIVMLNKSKSNPLQRLKMVFVLPFLALFLFNFSTETRTKYLTELIPAKQEVQAVKNEINLGETLEIIFTKETTKESFDGISATLKEKGVDMNILEIRRGENNYITKINIEFKTKNGSANYNMADSEGITPFYFRMKEDGSFAVGSVKNSEVVIESKVIQGYKANAQGNATSVWVEEDGSQVKIIELDSSQGDQKIVIKDGDEITYEVVSRSSTNLFETDDSYSFVYKSGASPDSVFTFHADSLKLKGMTIIDTEVDTDVTDKIIIQSPGTKSFSYVKLPAGANGAQAQTIRFRKGDRDGAPLLIVDGKAVSAEKMHKVDADKIQSMNVLKGDSAVSLYGKEAKNGVVVITTKSTWTEKADKNPFNVATTGYVKVGEPYFLLAETPSLYKIDKLTTGIELDKLKDKLESQGIDVKYSKIKRNELGEIISIKIALKNNTGSKSSASFRSDDGISPVYFGEKDGVLIVSSNPPQ